MTLEQLLEQTGHPNQPLGDRGAIQVFHHRPYTPDMNWLYYRLSDYVVSSSVSGPSLILIPKDGDS